MKLTAVLAVASAAAVLAVLGSAASQAQPLPSSNQWDIGQSPANAQTASEQWPVSGPATARTA
jgi:hypothetical protein